MRIYVREDLAGVLAGDPFAAIASLPGRTVRRASNRRTFRFEHAGAAYFAKVHAGVGWREIFKALTVFKPPVVSAANEHAACRHLAKLGIRAPRVAAFGVRGANPATRESFVVCDALDGFASLDEVVRRWRGTPPRASVRFNLARKVGRMTRDLHDGGVNHRDYYFDHLLVDAAALERGEIDLAVIDLHRARVRRRVGRRWLRRDLAALCFSARGCRCERTDLFASCVLTRHRGGRNSPRPISRARRASRARSRRRGNGNGGEGRPLNRIQQGAARATTCCWDIFPLPVSDPAQQPYWRSAARAWLARRLPLRLARASSTGSPLRRSRCFALFALASLEEDIDQGLAALRKEWKLLLLPVFLFCARREHAGRYVDAYLLSMALCVVLSFAIWLELVPPFNRATVADPVPFGTHVVYNPLLALAIYLLALRLVFERKPEAASARGRCAGADRMTVNMFIHRRASRGR